MILGLPFFIQAQVCIDARKRIVTSSVGDFTWRETQEEKRLSLPAQSVEASLSRPRQVATDEQMEELIAAANLSEEGKDTLREVFRQTEDVWKYGGVGTAKGVEHEFKMKSYSPIKVPPRPVPLHRQKLIDDELDKMLAEGAVTPSTSAWCTNPLLVPKKDGTIRFVVDYRRLNDMTVPDRQPLPRIEHLIASISESKYFALLDLRSGYWHIPLASHERHFTAFRTHRGLYEFTVMPFGLSNAPATFQRWINNVLGDLRYRGALAYLDDILIHAKTEAEFLQLLIEVMQRLQRAGARMKLSKCEINPTLFNYLGHAFTDGVRQPQQERVEALRRIKAPADVRGVRRLLGGLGFYRLYVPQYSDVALPITRLLRKGVPFKWGSEQQAAHKKVTDELATSTLQAAPTGDTFRLETKASEFALSGVLYDKERFDKGEKVLPITFLSKTLSEGEAKWSDAEKDAYAIVWALEACDSFVRGRPVEVICGHDDLKWMTQARNGKLARWTARLTEYDISVKKAGKEESAVVDFLSCDVEDPMVKDTMFCFPTRGVPSGRRGNDESDEEESEVVVLIPTQDDSDDDPAPLPPADNASSDQVPTAPRQPQLREETSSVPLSISDVFEPTCEEILRQQMTELPDPLSKGLTLRNGRYIYLNGIWVPPSLRLRLLDAIHLLPPLVHPSGRKMVQVLRRLYNWPGLQQDVAKYIQGCVSCQRVRPGLGIANVEVKKHPVEGPFEKVYMDFWGEVAWNGNRHLLLTMFDHSTKWAEAALVEDKTSRAVAEGFLQHWIARFGAPRLLVSDNDESFVSEVIERLNQVLAIKGLRITVYHPEGNAPVESFHRHLKKCLRILRSTSEKTLTFSEVVSWTMMAHRALPHTSTFDTPAYLTHGVDIRLREGSDVLSGFRPGNVDLQRMTVVNEIRSELARRAAVQREIQATAPKDKIERLKIGDLVLCRLTPRQARKLGQQLKGGKLLQDWSLPMRVDSTNRAGTVATLRCLTTGLICQAHANRLRRVQRPMTAALQDHWDQVCGEEGEFKHLLPALPPSHPTTRNKRRRVEGGG